MMWICVIGLHR